MSESDTLLTTTEAAEYLQVRTSTLTYWRCKHVGPKFVRLGEGTGRVRYRRADLVAYAAQSIDDPAAA
ncbi:helix-turn-helix domain-containing protein [Rhodococcus sp. T2V]|uniref:helix-turn-helix transcriptional regulator n=1 Tax=Rhodococcus sp. T2V TaxID=3034164 RepID=UPI0023E2638A|nr:helix-turn-helix domain-containing protein [Rhodococcus sp. T2V]MDF3313458.1 helix-turn-helix domain-containing protein [Rhodococcus sp. T2V]